mgnify:CR=1 FL=1
MKKFITHIASFFLVFIVIFASILIFNFVLVSTTKIDIPVSKKILILGDSNSECAINDSIYNHSINLSASSDSYFYSYLKLNKIIESNQIDTLMLSFSPQNIFDNGWLFNDSHIYSRFRIYYPLMNRDDMMFLIKNNLFASLKSTFAIPKQAILNTAKKLINKPYHYGQFNSLNRNILFEVQEKLKKGEKLPFFKIPETLRTSDYEIKYLNKIIYLCNRENIKLVLVNMPKRRELLEYSKYGVKEFNNFYDLNYSNIEYFDFSKLKMPDDFYGDFVHLNIKGSTYFSQLLNSKGLESLKSKYERTTKYKNNSRNSSNY